MPFSDSLFLAEIKVEKLFSYEECKEFYIKSKFADIFTLNLKDPNDLDPFISTKKSQKKSKVKSMKGEKPPSAEHTDVVMFASPIDTLITTMKNFPIELSLFNKDDPYRKFGSTYIPWSPIFIDYLYDNLYTKSSIPVQVSRSYTVYNEFTSKRVATIKLKIKLSLKDKLTSSFRSVHEENRNNVNMYTGLHSKVILKSINEAPPNNKMEKTGVIKVHGGEKRKIKPVNRSKINKKTEKPIVQEENKMDAAPVDTQKEIIDKKCKHSTCIASLVKSNTDLDKNKQIDVPQTTSCSDMTQTHNDFRNGNYRPVNNETFVISYFTVENDIKKDTSSSSNKKSTQGESSASSKTFKLNICDKDCPSKRKQNTCTEGMCSLDLPTVDAADYNIGKCKRLQCNNRQFLRLPPPPDDRILLNLTEPDCCNKIQTLKNAVKAPQTIENVVGGVKAELKFKEDCCCSCECTFGFVKHTTYCDTCHGYEVPGEDMPKQYLTAPHPCPIYHKLNKKNKPPVVERIRHTNCEDFLNRNKSPDRAENAESGEGKGNKYKLDDRFIFHYGFTGIPPGIGHSKCGLPCTGGAHLGIPVPKNMGWLWTADNVPGLKFRPKWKPGAVHKHVLHLLKIAKHPGLLLSKRRRKDTGNPKKPLKRPLLTVTKKDGEYTVTMETMKVYPKQRARNQQPFEDKPLLNYTIGRTEEENRERKKKKERDKRRLERDKREFIQSAFTDMCKDICLKTYQQALGILPGTGDPVCPCYPKEPGPDETNLDRSCSCSDDVGLLSLHSETDSDEWIVEFTPPNAIYDPTYVGKKIVKTDNTTQYTYLDYKVKVLDRNGNQVPRFFKGPNGKTQCSDLGGFWSPEHKWLEINTDGYIGPDGRWAPMFFIGPKGEQIDCDDGKFQFVASGNWFTVGIDGYVDGTGRWKFYPKPKTFPRPLKKHPSLAKKKGSGDNKDVRGSPKKPSEVTWSCFGDANPKDLSKMGIFGHGNDRKVLLKALEDMVGRVDNVKNPKPLVISARVKSKKNIKVTGPPDYDSHNYFTERQRCKHSQPSDKGIIAVDGRGNKTYFSLRDYKNRRPTERITNLDDQGISVSAFHVPCFTSFINAEIMKKQLLERRQNMYKAKNPSSSESNPKYINEYRYIA